MSTQRPPKVCSMSARVAGMPAPGSPEKKRMRKSRLRGSMDSRRAVSAKCSAFRDASPVVRSDAEYGGAPGGAAGAVDARHVDGLDAEIVAEGRRRRLGLPQLGLLHHREAREVVEALEGVRRDARLLPPATVEGAPLPRVAHLAGQLGEDERVAGRRLRALDLGQPVLGVGLGPVGGVVARRPDGQVDAARPAERGRIQRGHGVRTAGPPPDRGYGRRWSRGACPAGSPRPPPGHAAPAHPRRGSRRPRRGACPRRRPRA